MPDEGKESGYCDTVVSCTAAALHRTVSRRPSQIAAHTECMHLGRHPHMLAPSLQGALCPCRAHQVVRTTTAIRLDTNDRALDLAKIALESDCTRNQFELTNHSADPSL